MHPLPPHRTPRASRNGLGSTFQGVAGCGTLSAPGGESVDIRRGRGRTGFPIPVCVSPVPLLGILSHGRSMQAGLTTAVSRRRQQAAMATWAWPPGIRVFMSVGHVYGAAAAAGVVVGPVFDSGPAVWCGPPTDWIMCVILALGVAVLTAVWWELRHGCKHLDKSTQAQTTYTALRSNVSPRFHPLAEGLHGCWPG